MFGIPLVLEIASPDKDTSRKQEAHHQGCEANQQDLIGIENFQDSRFWCRQLCKDRILQQKEGKLFRMKNRRRNLFTRIRTVAQQYTTAMV